MKKREKRKHHSQYGTYGVYFITYWVIDKWCMQNGWLGVCRDPSARSRSNDRESITVSFSPFCFLPSMNPVKWTWPRV